MVYCIFGLMKIVILFFRALWRIWFYVLMGISIALLCPFLFVSTLSPKWYLFFYKTAKTWAAINLYGMGFWPKIYGVENVKATPYIIVANHASMIDILLLYYALPTPFVFVGKKELASLPLFGYFYKRSCILVDRGKAKSRYGVYAEAAARLNKGLGVCIFPEGGIPKASKEVVAPFKDGAFRLAIAHQTPLLPISIYDTKARFPYFFLKGSPGRLRLKIHKPIEVTHFEQQARKDLKDSTRALLLDDLNAMKKAT